MFACSEYELTDEFAENISKEAEDNISRLRHHASLAIWCGNNEMETAWVNWSFAKTEKHRRYYIQMFEEIRKILMRCCIPLSCFRQRRSNMALSTGEETGEGAWAPYTGSSATAGRWHPGQALIILAAGRRCTILQRDSMHLLCSLHAKRDSRYPYISAMSPCRSSREKSTGS